VGSLCGWDLLGHNLLLSQASFGGNPLMDGIFLATTCCCLRPLWWESLDGWDFGYQEASFTNLYIFYDGILAITKPFLTNFFFFHDGILAITKPFSRTFSFFMMEFSRHAIWGKTLFYIYQKEYLHRIRLVKSLASWFRAPFAGKRVRSFLF
jgi:hypothetical protein